MIEKHIVVEDIDPVALYGVNNANMQIIKALYPKLRIVARGNVIHVMGDELEMCALEENIQRLQEHIHKYNTLSAVSMSMVLMDESSLRCNKDRCNERAI